MSSVVNGRADHIKFPLCKTQLVPFDSDSEPSYARPSKASI